MTCLSWEPPLQRTIAHHLLSPINLHSWSNSHNRNNNAQHPQQRTPLAANKSFAKGGGMDAPHFFSDCVADMEGGSSYLSTFDREERDAVAYQQDFSPYDDSTRPRVVPTPSPSRRYPSLEGTWIQLQNPQDFMKQELSRTVTQYYDSALQGPEPLQIPNGLPGTSSTTPDIKSTPRTRSSTNSIAVRKSKSTSASTVPPPEPPQPKKKRGRKGNNSSAVEEEAKRNKFLERNRVAASKCRQKKKEYVSELEETKVGLESQHSQLQMEYNLLLGEVSRMKGQLMSHASCNDANIDKWIQNEARRFVQGASDRYGQVYAPSAYGQMSDSRQLSIASASSSYRGSAYEIADSTTRRGSLAFSHASSLQTSPVNPDFAVLSSPPSKRDSDSINYDHVPDGMFSPLQQNFAGR